MGPVVITTRRLALRGWTVDDVDELVELVSDREVSRFIHRGEPIGTDQALEFVTRQMRTQQERGWCRWALESHEAPGRPIGWCGTGCTFAPEVELGWTLRRDHWGRGLATEAAVAALAYLFAVVGFDRIISAVDPANTASVRVAEKIGMRAGGNIELDGVTLVRYTIDNPLPAPARDVRFVRDCEGEPGGSSLATGGASD